MIGRITGVVVDKGLDGTCVLDVRGVGYEVVVPLRVVGRLAAPPEVVTLQIHTHVREDLLRLYGFESVLDRMVFRSLLGISGVGPKLAMALLGEMTASEIGAAIARGDKKRLSAVSGIGAKLAARLLLELKDKLPPLDGVTEVPEAPVIGRAAEVAAALSALGFSRAQAEAAAAKVVAQDDARPVETLVRNALSTLA